MALSRWFQMFGSLVAIEDPQTKRKTDPISQGPFIVYYKTDKGAYVLKDKTGDIVKPHYPPRALRAYLKTR